MRKIPAYKDTAVPIERSQSHIRELLYKYGADGIQFSELRRECKIQMRFMYEVEGEKGKGKVTYMVRIEAAVPEARTEQRRGQNERSCWRAVYWALKSRMESISYGIETFEQAFLAHFEAGLDEKGRSVTIGDRLIPRLRAGQLALPEGKQV